MRNLLIALCVLGFSTPAFAQNVQPLLPEFGNKDFQVKPYGWTWSTANDDGADPLAMARIRFPVTSETTRWGAFVEVDVTNGIHSDQNWLRLAYATYDAGNNVEWRAGRLFLAPPRATQPPFLLRTAEYARNPFRVYGYGVQMHTRTDNWEVTWDVTANSSSRFNAREALDGLETSARITRLVSDQFEAGVVVQIAESSSTFAVETTWRPAPDHYINAYAYTTTNNGNIGGAVLYAHQLTDNLELHAQTDYLEGASEELLLTAGARLSMGRVQLILDQRSDGQTLARLQTRF